MIIDFRVHAGKSLFGMELSQEEILYGMEHLQIDICLLHPVKPLNYHLEPENDRIKEMVDANPKKFRAFGRVDPWRKEEALEEVERIFSRLKLEGLFLHPLEEHFSLTDPVLKPVLVHMEKIGKPVMICGGHSGVSHPCQIRYIAKEFPSITFIVTSAGQINISGLLLKDASTMLKSCPNVIMETSGIYRRDFIEQMTKVLGADRVVFGSGMPYYNQDMEMQRIITAKIDKKDKNKILGETAQKLLNI